MQCAVIEMVGRRKLLIAGYGLMACCGSIFTVALCLQVVGLGMRVVAWGSLVSTSLHPLCPLLQSPLPCMPYLAMFCIFALILSFGLDPGEWAQGALHFGLC